MASIATFPQWKLTFPNVSVRHAVLLVAVLVASIAVILVLSVDSCGLFHMEILRGLDTYHGTLDPELCLDLLDDIYRFNDMCSPTVEIIDCG